MNTIRKIMNKLNIDEETAKKVLEEMECGGLDFSECTQKEFDAEMKMAFEAVQGGTSYADMMEE